MPFWFQILISNISQQAVTKAPNLISLHALRKIYEPRSGMGRWGRGMWFGAGHWGPTKRFQPQVVPSRPNDGNCVGNPPQFFVVGIWVFSACQQMRHLYDHVWARSGTHQLQHRGLGFIVYKDTQNHTNRVGNPISGYFWTSSCSFDSPPARWGPLDLNNTSRGYPPTYTLTHIPATPSPSCHLLAITSWPTCLPVCELAGSSYPKTMLDWMPNRIYRMLDRISAKMLDCQIECQKECHINVKWTAILKFRIYDR